VLQARRVVAVLGPVSESRNQADSWYATAIGELLVRELALGERLRVVASRSVQRMLQESQLRETKQLDQSTLAQVRKRLDAEIVISGSYQLQGATEGQLQLSLLAQDSETGQILARSVVAGRATEVFGLVAQAGQIIRRQLGVEDGVAQHATGLRVANPDTLKRYGEALRELRGFRLREAGELLSRVVSSDPDFSPAYEALATVWRSLRYDVKAREVLKHAVEHTTGLQREEAGRRRLLLEARYQESLKNWERALATYQTLMRLFPDNPEYPLAYGEAQLASGGHQAAIATLTQLQQNNERAQLDPRIDAALARALEDKGDFRAAHERYEAAIAKSRAIGATLLVARCLVAQAYVKKFLGEAQGVLPNLEMAIAMFRQAGAQLDVADALAALAAKGWILRDRGDAKQAFAVFYDALAILLDAGSGNGTAIHLGNLALLLLRAGDLSLATARAEASLVLSREMDYKEAYATALLSLGWIELYRAQLDAATGRAQQAARIAKEQGDELLGAWSNWLLGETLLLRGELGPAREKHQLALEQRSVVGSRGFVGESRAALAYLELLSGNPAAAVAHAEQAVPLFHEDGQLDGEAWALAVFGAAQAASGHSPEALLLARQAETLNRVNPYLPMRITILCVLARIYAQLALREESDRCLQEITQVQRDARLVEHPTKRLELALASARLRLVVAPGPEVFAALQSLRTEAEQAGILQVATEASQLLTRHQNRNQQGGSHAP
jgi:tetratricopeptide (TPR) repeat protein